MRYGLIILLGAVLAAGSTLAEKPLQAYGRICELQNDSVVVKIAPQIGRVIYFGFKGGTNILWLNDKSSIHKALADGEEWPNWGGDKVWPAQQADWRFIYGGGDWPPKTELDGEPFKVIKVSPRLMIMESPIDSKLHVRLRRTFLLEKKGATLRIENELIQIKPTPWPVQIWSVTQSRPPEYTLLDISMKAPDREKHPFKNLRNESLPAVNAVVTNSVLRLSLKPELGLAKAGTIGEWCAAVYNDKIFVQKLKAPMDGCYPDGANIEVFSCGSYTELELLSPSTHLDVRKRLHSTTIWKLLKTTPEVPVDQKIRQIRESLKYLR